MKSHITEEHLFASYIPVAINMYKIILC